MLKKLCEKVKEFAMHEDGSELMQWAIIIIIVAALAGVAYVISDKVTGKLNDASNVLDGIGPSTP